MHVLIERLKKMSKNAYQFIWDNTSICVSRNRNIDMYDAIAYKLYYSNSNTTQEEAVIKVNKFRPNNVCTRQALNKKEQRIPVEFYRNFVDVLYKSATATLCKNNHGYPTQNIVAVDGTYVTLKEKLIENGYKSNKNGQSVTSLVTGMFNVTYNFPITFEMTKHKNERKAFMDLIKDPTRYQNTIFVFDRGYFSEELFESIQNKGLFFICRMRKNSLLINHNEDDTKVKLKNGHDVRIVTYTIDEKEYYMATTNARCAYVIFRVGTL